jgi:membrane-anchored protein YejM (alkaline phosphatase superfamily)
MLSAMLCWSKEITNCISNATFLYVSSTVFLYFLFVVFVVFVVVVVFVVFVVSHGL